MKWKFRLRRKWLRIAAIALPVTALITAWGFTLIPSSINTEDPVVVSKQFVMDIQANHPNKAYKLMSSKYQKITTVENFSKDFVSRLYTNMPVSEPQHVSTTTPPDGKNLQARVTFTIPSDGFNYEYRAVVGLIRKDKNWYVDSMSANVGKDSGSKPDMSAPSKTVN
jgi:hypothetical protein